MRPIDLLRQTHSQHSCISFSEVDQIIIIHINNNFASCRISLYGAQVLSFRPKHHKNDLLWISHNSFFEPGKAIRGGIPICFPWFGPGKNGLPQHGFARLTHWQLTSVLETANEGTQLTFTLRDNEETLSVWNHSFEAKLIVYIHLELRVELKVTNTGNSNFEYSDALHTYLKVGNIEHCKLVGLHNVNYLNPDAAKLFCQLDDELVFTDEVNRRYFPHRDVCTIRDDFFKRKIIIEKQNSKVTVVWNPGENSSLQIKDMAALEYKSFICVEAANILKDVDMVHLQPGESHILGTTISVME